MVVWLTLAMMASRAGSWRFITEKLRSWGVSGWGEEGETALMGEVEGRFWWWWPFWSCWCGMGGCWGCREGMVMVRSN